jgi:hypothetical protein
VGVSQPGLKLGRRDATGRHGEVDKLIPTQGASIKIAVHL